jgi:hydroxymethylglutaryl-CoA reductase
MTLHARQVAAAAGAIETQIKPLAEQMVNEKIVRIDRAIEILQEWNGKRTGNNHD